MNSSLLPVHVVLAEREIPFRSPLTSSVLDRTLLRAALAWIRLALHPDSMKRADLFEAIRRPSRGLTRLLGQMIGSRGGTFSVQDLVTMGQSLDGRRGERWDAFCDDIVAAAGSCTSTAHLLELLTTRIGLDQAAAALDAGRARADRAGQGDDLTALRRVATLCSAPALFESWLRKRLDTPSSPDGVLLSTVHRAKGMEWDHVLIFGADRGSMPHELSDDVEEERRVFHVAMTRGRISVGILVDQDRPSPFLAELEGTAPHPSPPPPSRPDRRPAPSNRVVERLKAWRLDQARSQGVPAYIVFNDTTLQALAARRPSTERALLEVPGIGPAKLEAYGNELLDLLSAD